MVALNLIDKPKKLGVDDLAEKICKLVFDPKTDQDYAHSLLNRVFKGLHEVKSSNQPTKFSVDFAGQEIATRNNFIEVP